MESLSPSVSPDRVLRYPEVAHLVGGVNEVTLRRWVRTGKFPRPFLITPNGRARGWKQSTVLEWIQTAAEAPR